MDKKYNYIKKLLLLIAVFSWFSGGVMAADYYWVGPDGQGGGGEWNAPGNWVTDSGSPTVVPGIGDDVYFTGLTRAATIRIRNTAAICRNLKVENCTVAPVIGYLGDNKMNINVYGSSDLQDGTRFYENIYYRDTGSPKSITCHGQVTFNDVYLTETNAVTLYGDFKATTLYVQAGTLNTNNATINLSSFTTTNSNGPTRLELTNSKIYVANSFNISYAGCTVDGGTSEIFITAPYSPNITGSGSSEQRLYNVTFNNPAGSATFMNITSANKVEFKGGGSISGNITFNELILASGKLYRFTQGNTTTIENALTVGGSICDEGWTTLKSANDGMVATISLLPSATVSVEGTAIKDITVTGQPTVAANNCADMGGNLGWTFTTGTENTLYWVDGGGYWNDKQHWSDSPGGTGGACIPGPGTNVVFNDESGFNDVTGYEVTLDGAAFCKDIRFEGTNAATAPTLYATTNNWLNIYGSSFWQAGMTAKVANTYYRNNGTLKKIWSNGVDFSHGTFSTSIYVEETTSIELADAFKANYFYLNAGELIANGINAEFTGMFTTDKVDNNQVVNIENATIKALNFSTGGSTVTVNAAGSDISVSYTFRAYTGQEFHNVSCYSSLGSTVISVNGSGPAGNSVKFNEVIFGSSVRTEPNLLMNKLTITPGISCQIASGKTITVNNTLTAGGDCEPFTTIKSSIAGSKCTISMPSTATVDVRRAVMSDVHAAGDDLSIFQAQNSENNGNNVGWTFLPGVPRDLYWVGPRGAGQNGGGGDWGVSEHWAAISGGVGGTDGACVPGPSDNVIFDQNSGFNDAVVSSRTVTFSGDIYCRNMTVKDECAQAPIIADDNNINATNALYIYGSLDLQKEVQIQVNRIRFQNTDTPKTIKAIDGATIGRQYNNSIHFNETTSVILESNVLLKGAVIVYAGIWDTQGFQVNIQGSFSASGTATKAPTINLNDSHIYVSSGGTFSTNNRYITFNAGTSHIHFTSGSARIYGYDGQTYHDVSFESSPHYSHSINSSGGDATSPGLTFNRVVFRSDGTINGNNTFKDLLLLYQTYTLQALRTQTVKEELVIMGTPCARLTLSGSATTRANINLETGTPQFNFVTLSNIAATGQPLHFGGQSYVANRNNDLSNITYDPEDTGDFQGLEADWTCHVIDDTNPNTYMLSAAGFYGNEYTIYEWKKVGTDFVRRGTGDTYMVLDISDPDLRYGTYEVTVYYTTDGVTVVAGTCNRSDQIMVLEQTTAMDIPTPFGICIAGSTTTIDDASNLPGENIKWYTDAAGTIPASGSTPLNDDDVYYVTQTVNGCESPPVAITIKLINCNNRVYINPMLRFRKR